MFGVRDDELTARWFQLGVFSPINRLHSTASLFQGKEPWNYAEPAASVMRACLRLRHRLIPYLHTMNERAHRLGEPLVLLLRRLDDRWTPAHALGALADELDSADADAVIASLILSVQRGGSGAVVTLTALADSIQERLKLLREIEAERAKPRVVVRQVTLITLVVLGGALLLGRSFFAPYGTPLGQTVLAVLLAAYVGSLAMLRRLTLPRRRGRILRSQA